MSKAKPEIETAVVNEDRLNKISDYVEITKGKHTPLIKPLKVPTLPELAKNFNLVNMAINLINQCVKQFDSQAVSKISKLSKLRSIAQDPSLINELNQDELLKLIEDPYLKQSLQQKFKNEEEFTTTLIRPYFRFGHLSDVQLTILGDLVVVMRVVILSIFNNLKQKKLSTTYRNEINSTIQLLDNLIQDAASLMKLRLEASLETTQSKTNAVESLPKLYTGYLHGGKTVSDYFLFYIYYNKDHKWAKQHGFKTDFSYHNNLENYLSATQTKANELIDELSNTEEDNDAILNEYEAGMNSCLNELKGELAAAKKSQGLFAYRSEGGINFLKNLFSSRKIANREKMIKEIEGAWLTLFSQYKLNAKMHKIDADVLSSLNDSIKNIFQDKIKEIDKEKNWFQSKFKNYLENYKVAAELPWNKKADELLIPNHFAPYYVSNDPK